MQQVELTPWRNGLLNELLLTLPAEGTWDELQGRIEAKLQEIKSSLTGRPAQLTLHLGVRSVSYEDLLALIERLRQTYSLLTVAIVATDLATQEAARKLTLNAYIMQPGSAIIASAGDAAPGNNALYLPHTVRSGQRIVHAGTVVVSGDVNAGAEVIAEGDILIFGTLRGLAHAGSQGDDRARIMAGNMRPQQLRIANQIARAPEDSGPTGRRQTEVAQIVNGAIHVTPY